MRTTTVVTGLALGLLGGCGADQGGAPPGEAASPAERAAAEVQIQVHDEGTGEEAAAGRTVSVHYTGWLHDPSQPDAKGTKFDSSVDRGEPITFRLGVGQVIRGWDEGLAGMRVGGTRTLIIPPDKAYGSTGAGRAIPPDATLVFDVELVAVQP